MPIQRAKPRFTEVKNVSGLTADQLDIGQIGGRRNILINGAMNVAQRGTSSTGLGGSTGYFTVDRWETSMTTSGRFTMSQVASGLNGFGNAMKLDCTTADTSIASDEFLVIQQKLEGQDLQQLKKGTSDAEQLTISFYAKVVGSSTDIVLDLTDSDNSRLVSKLFTLTTSWARYSWNVPADTTGAFDDDNAKSLTFKIWLHAGSNYSSGTLQTTWGSNTTANKAVGIDSFFSSTDNEFFLTGVQMEVGAQATPFEHRSFDEEMRMCQRYYYRTPFYKDSGQAANEAFPCVGNMDGTQTGAFLLVFPNVMRAAPTAIEQSGTPSHYSIRVVSDSNGTTGPTATGFTSEKALINLVSSGAGQTSGNGAFMRMENTDAFIAFDAEL